MMNILKIDNFFSFFLYKVFTIDSGRALGVVGAKLRCRHEIGAEAIPGSLCRRRVAKGDSGMGERVGLGLSHGV